MHALLITAAAALISVAIPAAAGEPSQFGRTAQLHQETSDAGESLDAFVTRIAPRARAASVGARAVVCGEILGSGPYTVTLKTDGYPDDCRVPKTAAPYVLVNGIAKDARAITSRSPTGSALATSSRRGPSNFRTAAACARLTTSVAETPLQLVRPEVAWHSQNGLRKLRAVDIA